MLGKHLDFFDKVPCSFSGDDLRERPFPEAKVRNQDLLEVAGYQVLLDNTGQAIPLAFFFLNYLEGILFPKGYHHLQRTYSNYPGKQGNWNCDCTHLLCSHDEKPQGPKVTLESSVPLPWGTLLYGATKLPDTTVNVLPLSFQGEVLHKRRKQGAACLLSYLMSTYCLWALL